MARISFTTVFDFTGTSNLINFTDTTDWAGQGINLADVNGSFRITAPDGSTIYDNTDYTDSGCDINMDVALTSQQTISFTPVLGNYTIIYTVDDTNAATQYTVTNVYNNQYVAPTIQITQTVDCIAPLFSQVDDTDYVVAGVTPTKSLINRLFFPVGSAGHGAPLQTLTSTLSTKDFYQGAQQSSVQATLSYSFPDGLTVNDVLTGVVTKMVDCTYYCSVICCITSQERLKESYRGSNSKLFEEQLEIFNEIGSYLALMRTAIECGKDASEDINYYIDTIKKLTNCTSDCDCSAEDNSKVIGFGSIIGADGTDGTDGVDGADGSDGSNGVTVLYNSTTIDTPSSGAFSSLKSYTLPANSLTQDGDALEIFYNIQAGASPITDTRIKLMIAGVTAQPKLSAISDMQMLSPDTYLSVKATVTRTSATTVTVSFESVKSDEVQFDSKASYTLFEPSITVANLTSSTNLIDVQGSTSGAETVVCKQLMIKQLLK